MARSSSRHLNSSFARHLNSRDRMHGNGVRQTLSNLREMGEHVAQAALNALKNGVYTVAAEAKSRCPVDTGKLRDSIKVTSNRDSSRFRISADAENDGYHYGVVVEFDPSINKPFMYPSLDEHKMQIIDNVRNAASHAIATGHA